MTERHIYDELARIAADHFGANWQIPKYGAEWPKKGKRLEMEISANEPIDPAFTGRCVTLMASFTGGSEEETAAAMETFCWAISMHQGAFRTLRLDGGENSSLIDERTKEITDTQHLTIYLQPTPNNNQ